MNSLDFLRRVLPPRGFYALATPFKIPGTDVVTYAHKVVDTVEAAEAYIAQKKAGTDIFFAVHSLAEQKVWNPNKKNKKTGEMGAYQVRVQSNMLEARSFFFDLDVGTSTDHTYKYETQSEALRGLTQFCETTRLPKPLVTSSGGGLHVFWTLTDALPSNVWKFHAQRLKEVAKHHGLLADPMRTTDTASVLRVADTFNFKDVENPRKVRVIYPGSVMPNDEFLTLLDRASIAAEVPEPDMFSQPPPLAELEDIESNLTGDAPSKVPMKALIKACPQVLRLAKLKGAVSEPEWYNSLGLMLFVEGGEAHAHKISAGYSGYSAEETVEKMHHWETSVGKPPTCAKILDAANNDLCSTCQFVGRVKSPVVAARYEDTAPSPHVERPAYGDDDAPVVTQVIPDPPEPYDRLADGRIIMKNVNSEGEVITTVIYENDLHPIRRISGEDVESQLWRVTLPRAGTHDFRLDPVALYDRRLFVQSITHQGIYPKSENLQRLQDYMIAYIAELQRLADAEKQYEHLGWTAEQDKFILPDKAVLTNGDVVPVSLSDGAVRSSDSIQQKGTLQGQIDLLGFYNHEAYVKNQFLIMCSLAAPFFKATGQFGAIINVTGDSGASKSTTLYTAAAMWGNPDRYTLNGTNDGFTAKARAQRVSTLSNLPVCVDEITHLPVHEAKNLAMNISQPGARGRLESSGKEQKAPDNLKSTLLLSSANSSLHSLLSLDNQAGTAGSMRVLEIIFEPALIHKKYEADDYLHNLRKNFGHIGPRLITALVPRIEEVNDRIRKKMREIDIKYAIIASERFWSGVVATALVIGDYAYELGLIPYAVPRVEHWAMTRQLPAMRGTVEIEYASPLSSLTDYLEHIHGNTLITIGDPRTGAVVDIPKQPNGAMLAHYDHHTDLMVVLRKPFLEYCQKVGVSGTKLLNDLHAGRKDLRGQVRRIVPETNARFTLGRGTQFAKGRSYCFTVDMTHPEMTDRVILDVVDGGLSAPTQSADTSQRQR